MLYQFIEVASCEISVADATLEQNVTRQFGVLLQRRQLHVLR